MAGVLVDVLLERLTTLAFDKVEREFNLVAGVKNEVKNLTRSLKAIQAVLEDAEQRQVTDSSIRRWLRELEDVSYEMDDVLDEWITQVQIHQMEKQERHNLAFTKKVRVSASSFFSASKVRRLNHRHQVANRIKELNERLALIDKEKQRFSFQSTTKGPELPERQQTTSFLPEKTFGRVEEKSLILGKLLSEGSGDETIVPVIIPIIGMGGMGKTTLAQLVYNDDTVKSHFDKRIWVCVSDPFEEVKIAKAIIEGLGGHTTSDELQTLSECIFKLTEGKKFLLVLDDVWNPNLSQWEELVKPLRKGAVGSRVLVTTRKEEVVIMMKANTHEIHLNRLGEELCLSLFFYYADNKKSGHEVFQAIGKEIVRKCNGLPLVAKTLGSHMCDKKTIQEWRDVLSSKIWENEDIEHHVFKALLLSYNDLSPIVKRCLLYCIIFAKDYVYDQDNLIQLWMSQDYVDVTRSLGKKYFYTLVRHYFFQDIEVDRYGKIQCKMHDILHDFLRSQAESECFVTHLRPAAREGIVMTCNYKIRHLTILTPWKIEHLVSNPRCEHLRTLVVPFWLASILQMKCLRTLNLCGTGIEEIPKKIGGLIHLRYLDLSKNRNLKEIIHLSSLYNLQTLRLAECSNLERVDLRGLTNLRHLVTISSDDVKLIGVDQLTNLQKLDQLNVYSDDVQLNVYSDDVQLGVLENLNQLQGSLSIRKAAQSNSNEAGKANLVSKEGLRYLGLHFGSDSWTAFNQQNDRAILNAIHPPPALESLDILEYAGNTLRTDWFLSLNSLTSLYLKFCTNCKHLPPLGKLPSLESLEMGWVEVEKLGVEFLGIEEAETPTSSGFVSFPKLKRLSIYGSYQLKEWKGVEELSEAEKKKDITIMPCLSELSLYGSDELPALPDFLWKTPLQQLDIDECPRIGELYRGGEGSENEWAKISHIPNIRFDLEWIQGQG